MEKDTQSEKSIIIKLDVGGKIFPTKKSTIDKAPVLKMMVDRDFKDEMTPVFIDADPHIFRHVLNYLRDQNYIIPEPSAENIYNMINFFGLEVTLIPRTVEVETVPILLSKIRAIDCRNDCPQRINITEGFGKKAKLLDFYFTDMDWNKAIYKLDLVIGDKKIDMIPQLYVYFKYVKLHREDTMTKTNFIQAKKFFKKAINNYYSQKNSDIFMIVHIKTNARRDFSVVVAFETELI